MPPRVAPGFDEVIHPAPRLAICAFLAEVAEADFATVRDALQISDSSLSKHAATLRTAGYVLVAKSVFDGRPRTWLSLTKPGRAAYEGHVRALRELLGL